jgi:hypothetical protein
MKRRKPKPLSEKQRRADDELRELLKNADLKKFGEALKKVVNAPKAAPNPKG